ncbi:MAG: diacylglycerol kinase family protein [Anaerolineae bacterium]|nr:MAG: diacylglycerol kinase family protein [Anaerolineae bacterium]
MTDFLRSRIASFRYAFSGWWYVLRTQRNAWIHALITVTVIVLGIWLKIGAYDWLFLLVAAGFVWFAEFLNTALEAVVDLASPAHHPLAKVGKDVGAAAVLIAAGVALVIGAVVLGPPLLLMFSSLR